MPRPASLEVKWTSSWIEFEIVDETTGKRSLLTMPEADFAELGEMAAESKKRSEWLSYACDQCGNWYDEITDPKFEKCECGGNYAPTSVTGK